MYDQWSTVHHSPITAGCTISDPLSVTVLLLQDVRSVIHCLSQSYYCRMYDRWSTVHHGPTTAGCMISDLLSVTVILLQDVRSVTHCPSWSYYSRMYDQWSTIHHGPITVGCMISDPLSIMVLLLQDVWSVPVLICLMFRLVVKEGFSYHCSLTKGTCPHKPHFVLFPLPCIHYEHCSQDCAATHISYSGFRDFLWLFSTINNISTPVQRWFSLTKTLFAFSCTDFV